MRREKLTVLLIGEDARGSEILASLTGRGCECAFATCCKDALSILERSKFDLVLTPMRLRDGSMFGLMALLEGSVTTIFYSCAVEMGCLWLPALRNGQLCFGSAAHRSREFSLLLNHLIGETKSGDHEETEMSSSIVEHAQRAAAFDALQNL